MAEEKKPAAAKAAPKAAAKPAAKKPAEVKPKSNRSILPEELGRWQPNSQYRGDSLRFRTPNRLRPVQHPWMHVVQPLRPRAWPGCQT